MKSRKILNIQFLSMEDLHQKMSHAIGGKETFIQKSDSIAFGSIAAFRAFMTVQKLEILTAIASKKPSSIYELAKILERDVAPVQRDCTVLQNTGFIVLKESESLRKSKVPRLKFDYDCILVHLPQLPYKLHFKAA